MAKRCPPGTKLVPAYCRSIETKPKKRFSSIDREAQAELAKLEKYVQKVKKTFGYFDEKRTYTAKDVAMKALVDKVQETPLFIAFAVSLWNQKHICQYFPDAMGRFAFIAKEWKQSQNGTDFTRAATTKYAVLAIVSEAHLRSRR